MSLTQWLHKLTQGIASRDAQPLSAAETKRLQSIDARLHTGFKDLHLLHVALTHKSYANESSGAEVQDNERLEFLGDAVLDLAVSAWLMREFPEEREGKLSQLRSSLVSEKCLAQIAQNLELGDALNLGKGERLSGGAQKPSLLANTYEAILGALFLDRGYAAVEQSVNMHFKRHWDELRTGGRVNEDFKTKLQELAQERFRVVPKYVLINQSGPDHDRTFEVALQIRNETFGLGRGRSKKEAEQEAAAEAFAKLSST